jgi:hypothetical protein
MYFFNLSTHRSERINWADHFKSGNFKSNWDFNAKQHFKLQKKDKNEIKN